MQTSNSEGQCSSTKDGQQRRNPKRGLSDLYLKVWIVAVVAIVALVVLNAVLR